MKISLNLQLSTKLYMYLMTALKLNAKSRKYTDIHNDSKEIVS